MRHLSFSEPFDEEGPQYLRLRGSHRCYHAQIPLVYALLSFIVILALATAVTILSVRPNGLNTVSQLGERICE